MSAVVEHEYEVKKYRCVDFKEDWIDQWGNELNIFDWAINNPFSAQHGETLFGSFIKKPSKRRKGAEYYYDPLIEGKTIHTFKLSVIKNQTNVSLYLEVRSFNGHVLFDAEAFYDNDKLVHGSAKMLRKDYVVSEFVIAFDMKNNPSWVKSRQVVDNNIWDFDFRPDTSERFFDVLYSEFRRYLRDYDDFRPELGRTLRRISKATKTDGFMNEVEMKLFEKYKNELKNPMSQFNHMITNRYPIKELMRHIELCATSCGVTFND